MKLEFRAAPKADSGLFIVNGKPVNVSNVSVSVGAVARCKCNGEVIEPAFTVGSKGGIGLQSEVGKFVFRNILIKLLP